MCFEAVRGCGSGLGAGTPGRPVRFTTAHRAGSGLLAAESRWEATGDTRDLEPPPSTPDVETQGYFHRVPVGTFRNEIRVSGNYVTAGMPAAFRYEGLCFSPQGLPNIYSWGLGVRRGSPQLFDDSAVLPHITR
jgi:hypothetical protein